MIYLNKKEEIAINTIPGSMVFSSLYILKDNDSTINVVEETEIPKDAEQIKGLFTYNCSKNTIWDPIRNEFINIDEKVKSIL